MTRKAYIAGKITGNPNFKEEFKAAEDFVKGLGFTVMNPSTVNEGFEQAEYWHICMSMIDVCDTVFFLPNWVDSKGSHVEYGYAMGTRKMVQFLQKAEPNMTPEQAAAAAAVDMVNQARAQVAATEDTTPKMDAEIVANDGEVLQ